jgi:hypothetical protein
LPQLQPHPQLQLLQQQLQPQFPPLTPPLPLPQPQQHSRMTMRMIHRQPQSFPLFHMFYFTSLISLKHTMREDGPMQLDREKFFSQRTCAKPNGKKGLYP